MWLQKSRFNWSAQSGREAFAIGSKGRGESQSVTLKSRGTSLTHTYCVLQSRIQEEEDAKCEKHEENDMKDMVPFYINCRRSSAWTCEARHLVRF